MSAKELTGYPSIDKPWLKYYSEEAIKSQLPPMTVYDYLTACNEGYEGKDCFEYFGKRIKYADLHKNILVVASALSALGVKQGDRVSLCLPTMPETFYLFYAINYLGAIANMIDPRINEERIEMCIGTQSKCVFIIDIYAEKIVHVASRLGVQNCVIIQPTQSLSTIYKIIYSIKRGGFRGEETITYNRFLKAAKEKNVEKCKYQENRIAAIVYTSGTTGIPKGVLLTNENINGVSYQQKNVLPDMNAGDSFLDIMPPFIAYGLVCGLCTTLTVNLKLFLIPVFEPKDFSRLIKKYRPNHILGVPMFFEEMCRNLDMEDLSFIKYCIAGGDKLNAAMEIKMNDYFKKYKIQHRIVNGYGMTELSSGVIISGMEECNAIGSVGIPLVHNIVKIMDISTGTELGYNEIGEVYVTGPTVMLGYDNNEKEEQKLIYVDGEGVRWVRTGDLGKINENGNVFIEGRLKRMIIRPDGHNVFPGVIEEVLLTHTAVKACVVVGKRSLEYENGQIPVAYVVLEETKDRNAIELELKELSRRKLPPRDVALEYHFIDEIPMTSVGKVNYRKLEEETCNV